MMEEWGIPTFYLQCMTNELINKLREKEGAYIPDIAIAGGFSTEDHIYKVLAMGAPHTKAVCMGRALMIPGFVGKNIDLWMKEGNLPKTVSEFGATKEEIFVAYETLKAEFGSDADDMPLGAIALYTFSDKLKVGLQQLMSGSRKFDVPSITRSDVFALTEEAAKVSGLDYVMDVQREEAMRIISE
jgi:glutamate synthase domain-containing protein 2